MKKSNTMRKFGNSGFLISFFMCAFLFSSCSKEEMVSPASNNEQRAPINNSLSDNEPGVITTSIPGRTSTPSISMPENALIYIYHGACFGKCPVYSVSLSSEGLVTYEGISNVGTIGRREFTVDHNLPFQLMSMMLEVGFLTYENKYPLAVDGSQTITGLRISENPPKMVIDYGVGVPRDLIQIRSEIESRLGISRLISFPDLSENSLSPTLPVKD